MKATFNIHDSMLNIQNVPSRSPRALNVECSLLNVFRLFIFAVLLCGLSTAQSAETNDLTTVSDTPVAKVEAKPAFRMLSESELIQLLTATLQSDYIKDKGELDLRFNRPWGPAKVPDEPLTIKVLDMPANGVSPTFILRFELRTADKSVGTWQMSVQAHVWRDIWVARSALKRGELVADADLDHQRRDVLTMRESLADFVAGDSTLELAEPLQSGSPLLARSVKIRPVIRRGQTADALIQDGALSVSMKVEALEDGAPGQVIRARSPQTRRDVRGKVLNEQTILLAL